MGGSLDIEETKREKVSIISKIMRNDRQSMLRL